VNREKKKIEESAQLLLIELDVIFMKKII